MNEKPTWWEYLTAFIAYTLYVVWAVYDYQNDPHKIPFEPLIAAVLSVFVIWGYLRWKQSKATDTPTVTHIEQNAEKIYDIETIKEAKFDNRNIKTNIETQYINYGDTKIPRFLTAPPFDSDFFIGRDKDLEAIENDYQTNNRLLFLVNGEGGMGKTTLASKYWYAHQNRYKHLAWLYVDRGIGAALVSLATALQIDFDQNDDEKRQIARITEGVNNLDMPCLLVFDNANDVLDVKKHYATLRQLSNCHIILTSRINQNIGMTVYKVKPLGDEDAAKLFSYYYPAFSPNEAAILEGICVAIGYNTLVLEILAKNLAVANEIRQHYTLSDLLEDLQKKGLLAIKTRKVDAVVGNKNYVETPVDSIIAAMYDLSALSDREQYLLSNFAVLPAENIAVEVLTELLKIDDIDDFDAALSHLNKKGWIEYREADSSFKISPVIQEVTKKKNAERLLSDCKTLIYTLINGLNEENRHNDNYKQATVYAYWGEAVAFAIPFADDDVATLCQNIGNFYKDTGNLNLMMQAYQKMVDIQSDLCQAEPDNADFKNGLAISYSKLGDTHSSLGNLDKALGFFDERNKLGKELYAAYPNNVDFKNGLAISYEKLGVTHSSLGNLDKALGFFDERNKLGKELYAVYSNNVDFKNNLAISYQYLGNTHSSLGNLDKALGYFEEYNRLEKDLYAAYPNNVDFKNNLAISYSKLGDTQSSLGNLDKALEFNEEANQTIKELYAAYPNNVAFKNGLAISYSKLGETQSSLGNLDKALEFNEEANQTIKELYAAYPNNVAFKNGLAISYSKLGETHSSLGNLDKALGFFDEQNKLVKELYAAYPNNVDFKNGLAISYSKLGDTHSSLGNLDKALGFFEERNKLGKELYSAYPNNVSFKNGLALSYQWLGWFLETKKNDKKKAKEQYKNSKLLLEELVKSFPNYVEFQKNLKWVEDKLSEK